MTRPARDRGSASIEAAVLAPALLLFVGMILAAGRLAIAHQSVEAAAAEAARSASIARTAAEARPAATASAAASLAAQGLQCTTSPAVGIDVRGFAAPPGAEASVAATVTCEVDLADAAVPGLPGTWTLTATMTSPIDTYRARS